ncbi:MAG: amidohydrolase family protein [Cyclobacteriaceae bacterium]|nr:amidohydrolase family protein [Cyclobacteriaceae bacterium]
MKGKIPELFKKTMVAPDDPMWITVGTLIDGETILKGPAHVVFNSRQILYTGSADRLPPRRVLKEGQTACDLILENYTMLPGLTDAHTHILKGGAELDQSKRNAIIKKDFRTLVTEALARAERLIPFGVMAMRDAGDKEGVGVALNELYHAGTTKKVPYIDSPAAAIYRRGQYGRFMGLPLDEHDSYDDCVKARADSGAYRIKLIVSDIVDFNTGKVMKKPQLSAQEVAACVKAARSKGMQIFAHASGQEGIENAILGGVDTIEHGFSMSEEQLLKMRDFDIAWVPTFVPVQFYYEALRKNKAGWKQLDILKKVLDQHAQMLIKAHELGVTIIAGSDAGSRGVPHGQGLLNELVLMEKAGMNPLDVLKSATGTGSERLSFRDKIGCLKKGYKPRFILTRHLVPNGVEKLQLDKYCFFDGALFESNENDTLAGL